MKRPNFFYVGAPKCASTYIWTRFREHPEIFVPDAKNTRYFDRFYDFGEAWFLQHFTAAGSEKRIGEVAEWYIFSEAALRRIRQDFPDARVLVCLREPLAFLKSLFFQDLMDFKYLSSFEPETHTFRHFAAIEEVVRISRFLPFLERILDIFEPADVHVCFFEDFKKQPEAFLAAMYEFLEVDPGAASDGGDTVVNPTAQARSPFMMFILFRLVSPVLWRLGLGNIGQRIYMSQIVQKILTKGIDARDKEALLGASPHELREMWERLHQDDTAIEKLLQRPLPQAWRDSAPQHGGA